MKKIIKTLLKSTGYKLNAIIFLLLLSNFCKGQSGYDSLKQYSYGFVGNNRVDNFNTNINYGIKQGTGFFVKVDSNIYFVTAKHCLVLCPTIDNLKNGFPDTCEILSNNFSQDQTLKLSTLQYRDSTKCKNIINDTDVIVNKMAFYPSLNFDLNYIEILELETITQ